MSERLQSASAVPEAAVLLPTSSRQVISPALATVCICARAKNPSTIGSDIFRRLMAGTNHHYLPRFLQRGFAVENSNAKKIWRFEPGKPPLKPRSIRATASEENFHSPEVDALITKQENRISALLRSLYDQPSGATVDGHTAASIIDHLAPRSAHLRQSFATGLQQTLSGVSELVGDQTVMEKLVGLNENAPNEVFAKQIQEGLGDFDPELALGIPAQIFGRMLFYIGQEQFGDGMSKLASTFAALVGTWRNEVERVAREGHDKGLASAKSTSPRWQTLAGLRWRLIDASAEGAILPDCVALAFSDDGTPSPLLLASGKSLQAVVMPIETKSLLVGTPQGHGLPALEDFNRHAARCSYRFFLAASSDEVIADLRHLIAEQAQATVLAAVDEALAEYRTTPESEHITDEETPQRSERSPTGTISCTVSFEGEVTRERAELVVSLVRPVLTAVASHLPLNRLSTLIFTDDVGEAVAKLMGILSGANEPSDFVSIGRTVFVENEGQTQSKVVLSDGVAAALISQIDHDRDWAIGVIVRQLVRAALAELPAHELQERYSAGPQQLLAAWLWPYIDGSLESYIASRFGGGFDASLETLERKRSLLEQALIQALAIVPAAKAQYRADDDLDALLRAVFPHVSHLLDVAAGLLGHSAALQMPAASPSSELERLLVDAGLLAWLRKYADDLAQAEVAFRERDEAEEVFALTIHVERLMWHFGLIPWEKDDGVWVQLPGDVDSSGLRDWH